MQLTVASAIHRNHQRGIDHCDLFFSLVLQHNRIRQSENPLSIPDGHEQP
jgi:hypothetical protein